MSFVLVISRDTNFRKFCVDNLVVRGYLAVGLTSAIEGQKLLENSTPQLVILYCVAERFKHEVYQLRNTYGISTTPIILIDANSVDPKWLAKWNIASQLDYPVDARKLVNLLHPWLEPQQQLS